MIQVPNFIDYLKSGLQLNMVAAIDFTGNYQFKFSFKWITIK